jgi:hypothetical protein
MSRLAGTAFALLLATFSAWSPDASAQQACTTRVANLANLGCGDANRGMVLYGQTPAPGITYTWACNQCHSTGSTFPPTPFTDSHTRGSPPVPVLLRAAPRDPGYIDLMMHAQPEVAPIAAAIDGCCIADRPPDNVWGDLGDIAEFFYTCKLGIAPCVTGGGGGGPVPGQLEGTFTKDFGNQAIGTTSAPLTLKLTNIGGATVNVSGATSSNASEFAIATNTCTSLSQATSCTITITFKPSTTGIRSSSITVTSDGLGSPQLFTFIGTGTPAGADNYSGIWWNASESGWGINLQHEGTVIFATWFTYDTAGKPWWLVMTAGDSGTGKSFTGTLYKTSGSWFGAGSFSAGTPDPVGTGTLTFTDSTHGSFDYTVNGTHQTKAITPQPIGPARTCTYSTTANLAGASNYQGLWWNASESGWGINFAHAGSTIFATWFTFDANGAPTWYVTTMNNGGAGTTYTGQLFTETATPFGVTPFVANQPIPAGSASVAFANGNSAAFSYTIGAVSKTKQLTHQPLVPPPAGTVCN